MAFIASTVALQRGFDQLLTIAMQEKTYLSNWNARLTSDITALDAVEWVANINRAVSAMDTIAALPGLAGYAQAQFANPGYEVATEYTAMRNALVAVRTWLQANIPANGITITNGVQVGATYSPAATAPLKALIVAAAATIA